MRIKLIRIGNSTGIRLPKAVIKECGLTGEAELNVRDGQVILSPVGNNRTDWQARFQADVLQNPVREKGEWEW